MTIFFDKQSLNQFQSFPPYFMALGGTLVSVSLQVLIFIKMLSCRFSILNFSDRCMATEQKAICTKLELLLQRF